MAVLHRPIDMLTFFYPRQFWPSGIAIACICLCVCVNPGLVCDNLRLIQARITKFGLEVQNTLVKICDGFFLGGGGGGGGGVIDLDLQSQI